MDVQQEQAVKNSIFTNLDILLPIVAWKTDAQFTKCLNGLVTMIYP
jgi:hypothetical protein